MKIAILTLPIHSNFGYLMQLYAMQAIIRKYGHEAYTFYIKVGRPSLIAKVKEVIYNIYHKILKGEDVPIIPNWKTEIEQIEYDKNTWDFVDKNIKLTSYLNKPKDFYNFDINEYDGFIVGSDQVWREPYSISLPLFFFDFLNNPQKKRMSYAASFGRGDITEYSKTQKKQCKQLLKLFDIVTVREKEGVDICLNEFEVDAQQVLDPTMLLLSSDYAKLAEQGEFITRTTPFVFLYLLDPTREKLEIANSFARAKGLEVVSILPSSNKASKTYPHVFDVLSGFYKSEYVFSDSFHASVFSIIFEKQFYVYPNYKRGNSRLSSLLKMMNISDRMIEDGKVTVSSIDYTNVNTHLNELRHQSICIIEKFLKTIQNAG